MKQIIFHIQEVLLSMSLLTKKQKSLSEQFIDQQKDQEKEPVQHASNVNYY